MKIALIIFAILLFITLWCLLICKAYDGKEKTSKAVYILFGVTGLLLMTDSAYILGLIIAAIVKFVR
jgi:hypothetical protein